MGKEIEEISIEKLIVDPMNVRDNPKIDEELIESIKQQGIIEPLVVRKRHDNGKFGVVSGSRRYTAAKAAGMKTVPCIVRDLNDLNARAISISENKHRRDIPTWKLNEVINDFYDQLDGDLGKEEKVRIIEKKTGLGRTTVQDYLEIGELPKNMQARLKKSSELSKSEKKQLKSMPISASQFKIPRSVMSKLARDKNFQSWARDEPKRAHRIATFSSERGQKEVNTILARIKRNPELSPAKAYIKGAKPPKTSVLKKNQNFLENLNEGLKDLENRRNQYIKQMLEFGFGAIATGLVCFVSFLTVIKGTSIMLEIPPISISLLVVSSSVPLFVTVVGQRKWEKKIEEMKKEEQKIRKEYQKSTLKKMRNKIEL